MNGVRVRYAPSPTGHLHLGSLRTALYNWLFARHHQGTFLVRIEDTDLERSRAAFTESILEALKWTSIEPDEPIVIQSERAEVHREVAQKLLDQGKAYRCFCTADELRLRLGTDVSDESYYVRYDQKCRTEEASDDERRSFVIRYKLPEDRQSVSFSDVIRGEVTFDRDQLDDFIIVRSDGTPMYNFVVVVDDYFMGITHVLRGEDHISNTPKQVLLYEACDYPLPLFAHFSMILGPDGQRLSKRHAATSVLEYKDRGFLASALCNYLARLGWSHGDQEIFTIEELIRFFDLDHMTKKGAIFDEQKLEWLNGVHIRNLSAEEILATIERDIDPQFKKIFCNWSSAVLLNIIDLYKERVKTLKELMDLCKSLHERPVDFTLEEPMLKDESLLHYMTVTIDTLSGASDFSHEAINLLLKGLCKTFDVPMVKIMQPLRIALTGKSSSPGVAHIVENLGKEESIERITSFREFLKKREE